MKEIIHLLSADIDIQSAFGFYENLREGLGAQFPAQLNVTYGQLSRFPESGRQITPKFRRALLSGYPCAIYYSTQPRGIMVIAVLDIRRNPSIIQARLK